MRAITAALAVLIAGCAEAGGDTNALDVEIWTAVTTLMCADSSSTAFLLIDRTVLQVGDTNTVDDSAFLDMRRRNKVPTAIPDTIACGALRVVSSETARHSIDQLDASIGTTYCVVTMSKPGYSFGRTVAIVYVDSNCPGGGGGDLVQFRRSNGVWELERVERVSFA